MLNIVKFITNALISTWISIDNISAGVVAIGAGVVSIGAGVVSIGAEGGVWYLTCLQSRWFSINSKYMASWANVFSYIPEATKIP